MAIITFQGKPLNTSGDLPSVGTQAPGFKLVNHKLQEVTLATFAGQKKVLSIVPSLDTPTCAASTRRFNQKAGGLVNTLVLVVSADLPFAQDRFCHTEKLKNVVPLSSFRSNFATDYGVLLLDTVLVGLMARALVILDEQDQVIYTELVAEIVHEPNYEQAFEALLAIT